VAWKKGEKKIRTAFNCRDCSALCEASEWRLNGGYRCAPCRAKYHRAQRAKRPESYGPWNKEYQRQHYRLNKETKHKRRVARRRKDPIYYMYEACKSRCKKKGIPFSISMDALFPLPKKCPVLGIEMQHNVGGAKMNSYSIDRIVPGRGYVPGNIRIISYRANTIKTNATPNELGRVAADCLRVAAAMGIPFDSEVGSVMTFSLCGNPDARAEAEITA
jgi:hypothetical protein